MNIPDEFKYDTLSELLEKRTKIKARPFPQGYSGEEHIMMMAVEEHCANTYMEALEFIKNPPDTGNCMTCDYQIGTDDMQHCRLGNDTNRSSCCYHSKSRMRLLAKLENVKEE